MDNVVRIIAGELGGRNFASPRSARTHPMSDKARGALFNVLGELDELTVLDAFAGSGALALEAVSRGAASAVLLEIDKTAQQTIAANIRALDIAAKAHLTKSGAGAWLQTSADTFDIVLCDPPYDDLQPNLLVQLTTRLKPGGIFVLSWPGKQAVPTFEHLQLAAQRSYGDMQLVFYRQIA